VRSRFLEPEPNLDLGGYVDFEEAYMSAVRITPRELRVRVSSSAEAGFLVQALLQVLSAEDVAFVPATKEVVVRKRGEDTIVSVLRVVQKQFAADGRSEITIRLDRRDYDAADGLQRELVQQGQ
jgi:hypothetical protein